MLRADASQVLTTAQDGSRVQYLGSLGHVNGLRYSFKMPGGCDQLSCNLQRSVRFRSEALYPGRIVQVIRGGSVVWDGKLLEPSASADGWAISASGSGNFGDDFMAEYGGVWANNPDTALNDAIGSRGLRWVNPGLNGTSGLFLGQQVDSGSQSITDLLNICTQKGGLTWYVSCRPRGNVVTMFPLPTVPDRILVCSDPVSRTLGGDVNKVWVRYQVTADSGPDGAGTFALTSSDDLVSQQFHGNMEEYADLSSAGIWTAGQAQALATSVLKRYQRASFADSFSVQYGQLLTMGGAPVDLGAEQLSHVYSLVLLDFGYGAEIRPGPVSFFGGAYEYDDDSQTATITPFQSMKTDFASLMSAAVTFAPVRAAPVAKPKKGK